MRFVAAALLLAIVTPAEAQTPDRGVSVGNGFFLRCKSPADEYAKWTCAAYLRGLVDGLINGWGPGCTPPTATYQQRLDVLLKYLTDNPASRHMDTSTLYNISMSLAFPCPTGRLPPMIEVEPLTR